MRKYLIIIGFVVFGLVIFSSYQADVQNPTSESDQLYTRTEIHEINDRIAQAALDGLWLEAGYQVEELQRVWSEIKPESTNNLNITVAIDRTISNLVSAVWSKNKPEVISLTLELKQVFITIFEK